LSVSLGIFDFMRENHRTGQLAIEYHSYGYRWVKSLPSFQVRPLLGWMGTFSGALYLYGGVNLELQITRHMAFAPGFAIGYYNRGHGKNLGHPIEFRSGIAWSWSMPNQSRLGLHIYHLSNASLARHNPGSESVVIYYEIPIKRKLP
jgi:hypothetical protein